MNTHDTFYLAHRAHNLLQPLIAEAKQQGINFALDLDMSLNGKGVPLTVYVREYAGDVLLGTVAYQYLYSLETLKEHEDQLDGLVEHVRDALAVRANLRTLVLA